MNKKYKSLFLIGFLLTIFLVFACNNRKRPPGRDIAATPEDLDNKVTEVIRSSIDYAASDSGNIDDTIRLGYTDIVKLIYTKKQFASQWSGKEQWKPLADSLFDFIEHAKLYGLFPEDYHYPYLDSLRKR